METTENHALTKAEGCYHCKPLVQQRNELAAKVERLRKLIMDKTAQPECCHRPNVDHEEGPSCCGNPDFTWPDDVVAVLSETPTAALAALKAQWQADALGEFYDHLQGMALSNGWNSDSDAYHVSEELKSWCKSAQDTQQ